MNRLKVLFLCTGNSCRSQMAEGWARHLKGAEIEAYSAASAEDPLAIYRRVRDEIRDYIMTLPQALGTGL